VSQEKVFQVRNNQNVQFWEVSQEEQEKLVNICGWEGRVLFTQPVAPAVTVDTPLPEPAHRGPDGTGSYFDSYSAAQMHDHAAAVAAKAVADVAAERDRNERMFIAACEALGLINEKLGLDPDDGGAEPILDAIGELQAKASCPQQHAQAALSDALLKCVQAISGVPMSYNSELGQAYHNACKVLKDSQPPAAAPEPCADPAQCEKQGCANPRGRCGEAAAPAIQQEGAAIINGLDAESWTKVQYHGFTYNVSAKLSLSEAFAQVAEIVGEALVQDGALPQIPEMEGLQDIPYALNTPDDWDEDYRSIWQKLQVAQRNKSQLRTYAKHLQSALQEIATNAAYSDCPAIARAALTKGQK
jgi:hypothetical protein